MSNASQLHSSAALAPALGIFTYVAAVVTDFLALVQPAAVAFFGIEWGTLLTTPVVFAALITFLGGMIHLGVNTALKWKESEWRQRAVQAEAALVKALKGE